MEHISTRKCPECGERHRIPNCKTCRLPRKPGKNKQLKQFEAEAD